MPPKWCNPGDGGEWERTPKAMQPIYGGKEMEELAALKQAPALRLCKSQVLIMDLWRSNRRALRRLRGRWSCSPPRGSSHPDGNPTKQTQARFRSGTKQTRNKRRTWKYHLVKENNSLGDTRNPFVFLTTEIHSALFQHEFCSTVKNKPNKHQFHLDSKTRSIP